MMQYINTVKNILSKNKRTTDMEIKDNDILTVQMVLEVCKKHRITRSTKSGPKTHNLSNYLKTQDPLHLYSKKAEDIRHK